VRPLAQEQSQCYLLEFFSISRNTFIALETVSSPLRTLTFPCCRRSTGPVVAEGAATTDPHVGDVLATNASNMNMGRLYSVNCLLVSSAGPSGPPRGWHGRREHRWHKKTTNDLARSTLSLSLSLSPSLRQATHLCIGLLGIISHLMLLAQCMVPGALMSLGAFRVALAASWPDACRVA
jgi:hypothetical protein